MSGTCGADRMPLPSIKTRWLRFERYFVADKTLHKETKGHYYALHNEAEVCDRILEEFGVKPGHIRISSTDMYR